MWDRREDGKEYITGRRWCRKQGNEINKSEGIGKLWKESTKSKRRVLGKTEKNWINTCNVRYRYVGFAWKVYTVFWARLHINVLLTVFDSTEALSCCKWMMGFSLQKFKKNKTKQSQPSCLPNLLGSCQQLLTYMSLLFLSITNAFLLFL